MEEAVKDGGGEDLVAEDLAPFIWAGTCSFSWIAAATGPYPSSAVLVGLRGGARILQVLP